MSRRTATKVRDGRVRKKNRSEATPNYFNTDLAEVVIDREPPGVGYRHLVRKEDVRRFIALLPNWKELSAGLNAIVLGAGDGDADGYHTKGVVIVCAWERRLWRDVDDSFVDEHDNLLERLRVPKQRIRYGWRLDFTEATARAYQLLHILLHELGHHHDRLTTQSKRRASKGEGFAEQYAARHEELIWDRYLDDFGIE